MKLGRSRKTIQSCIRSISLESLPFLSKLASYDNFMFLKFYILVKWIRYKNIPKIKAAFTVVSMLITSYERYIDAVKTYLE